MAAISYRNVGKSYSGSRRAAVHDVSLDVDEAAFVVLIGPSGCGKTTLLKMTNRLVEPTSGRIEVNGVDITATKVTELRRHMGYVIQQVGLFPHLTVATNVATVPRLLHWPRKRIAERVDELLELAGLEPAQYRDRYPKQLSGGQQQRVGLARALAADPAIMLMDEPFGAIDAITRSRLQDQLIEIQRRVRKTVLFVTHDVDEALKLADKLVIMEDGHVVQYDTPFKVLTQPSTPFVKQLLSTDDVLRKLGLITIRNAMSSIDHVDGLPTISAGDDLRKALSRMIAEGVAQLVAVEADGKPAGLISMETINRLGLRNDVETAEPALAAST
ncbi:MAG TPA: ABC transporter ATP-binding protein [Chloroflexota bacterium]|jgi:osmoprotectant transport system ATP-binding protein|nr:ABC transporter ATP-binding protein [Chloroflexota bacterium]